MPILYNEQTKTFRLDAKDSSYAFRITELGYLVHLYYGAHISDSDLQKLAAITHHSSFHAHPETPVSDFFSLDLSPMEYPCFGRADCRGTALAVRRADTGTLDTDITYVSHRIYTGKPTLAGQPATYATGEEADTLEILCRDKVSGAEVTLFYTVFRDLAAIARRAAIRNASAQPMELERALSLCVDFDDIRDTDVVHLYGDWARERQFERVPMMHGTQSVGSLRGASSHTHNPFLALCEQTATEESGTVCGFSLIYTGNFLASAEMDTDGGGRVLMGIHPEGFRWHLAPGEVFETPEAVSVLSSHGFGDMSRTYHRLYANHLVRGKWKTERRPILVNNWEATYFNFDEKKIYALAEEASGLGIEMLVLDDGWFGKRNSDNCALGDWYVNEDKLKGGLAALVKRIHGLGMKFGLWFEPEMISPDSDLYRAHPDWALHSEGRPLSVGRRQYVLDMTRPEVLEYLYGRISSIIDECGIDYIKWDFNRNLTEVGSVSVGKDRQGEVYHRYCLGLYELLERLHTAYPDLLLEGCSGGGGRFDPAWLYYAPQIWTSDDTDAIERLDIQYGTSMVYPPSSMSAHISACPNHQLKRTTPFTTRGNVALGGSFGYELDLLSLGDEEKALIRRQCADYHKYYDLTHYGDYYRLISPWKNRTECAWCFVSPDRSEALLTHVTIRGTIESRRRVKLQGLDPEKVYRVEETGEEYHGDTLMNYGYRISDLHVDFNSTRLHFVAI